MKTYSDTFDPRKSRRNQRKQWLEDNGYYNSKEHPRYLSAWKEVSEYFNFPFAFLETAEGNLMQSFQMPKSFGKIVSLTTLLQIKRQESDIDLDPILSSSDIQIIQHIKNIGFDGIGQYRQKDLYTIAHNLESGQKLNFVIPVCPDWEYDPITKIYTFNSVRDGIGLVALKAINIVPIINKIFPQHAKTFNFIVGDAMGLNPDQLQRANLSFTEFKSCCSSSRDKIQARLASVLRGQSFSVKLMTDILPQEYTLDTYNQKINDLANLFSDSLIEKIFGNFGKFNSLLNSRKSLYMRLYPHIKEDKIRSIFIRHLAEYNVFAQSTKILGDDLIILGFDAAAMHYGYKWGAPKIPVLTYRQNGAY